MTEHLEGAESAGRDVVRSLVRGFEVIRAFDARHSALTLDQTADRTAISRSAVRRLLQTLIEADLACFDGRFYRLTPRLLDLGYAQQSRLSLAEVAQPHCVDLSTELGRTVSLARIDGSDVLFLVRVGSPRLMHISVGVGTRLPAHQLAIGRVQLAWLSENELDAVLTSAASADHVNDSPGVPEDLRAELVEIRAQGWSRVSEVLEAGLSAIAVPVWDRTGRVVAGLNVSTPSNAHASVRELTEAVPALLRTAARIGADLHASHLT